MSKKPRVLKSYARENLLGRYGLVVGALIFIVVIAVFLNMPFASMLREAAYFGAIGRVAIGIIGIVVVMILFILFYVGFMWIQLQLARNRKTNFGDILYPFTNHPWRFVGFQVLAALVAVACMLPGMACLYFSCTIDREVRRLLVDMPLVFVIGIAALVAGFFLFVVIRMAWAMTNYLLLDHDDLRVGEAMHKSRIMMKRNKWRLWRLIRSFIGWLLFSMLTFFIALLWVFPYLMQSHACFYLELLSPEERHMGPEEQNMGPEEEAPQF